MVLNADSFAEQRQIDLDICAKGELTDIVAFSGRLYIADQGVTRGSYGDQGQETSGAVHAVAADTGDRLQTILPFQHLWVQPNRLAISEGSIYLIDAGTLKTDRRWTRMAQNTVF